ncbi:MAG: tRNA (guanosine(37)-N1)-methyltransferase TrmD [Actinomycetota bacterium]
MRIDVVTIFPEFFDSPLRASLLGRAGERGLLDVAFHDLRDHTHDRHRTVDDEPYGGGAGMVMKPEPWFEAVESIRGDEPVRTVLFCPTGRVLTQAYAWELAEESRLLLMCGRYEGVDERVRSLATDEVSIGDYVLAGGESAALVLIEVVSRLLPGVLGNEESTVEESFSQGLLEYPHYTRPAEFRGLDVPEILRSGDHEAVAEWRRHQALERTLRRRPDLLAEAVLSPEDRRVLGELLDRLSEERRETEDHQGSVL